MKNKHRMSGCRECPGASNEASFTQLPDETYGKSWLRCAGLDCTNPVGEEKKKFGFPISTRDKIAQREIATALPGAPLHQVHYAVSLLRTVTLCDVRIELVFLFVYALCNRLHSAASEILTRSKQKIILALFSWGFHIYVTLPEPA